MDEKVKTMIAEVRKVDATNARHRAIIFLHIQHHRLIGSSMMCDSRRQLFEEGKARKNKFETQQTLDYCCSFGSEQRET
jgi:hypothetical protein